MTMNLSKKFILTLVASSVLLAACGQKEQAAPEMTTPKANVALSAKEIADKYIIADTHIDVPMRLQENFEDVSKATQFGEFDYPRAVAGGLNAPFMSIYIPSELQETGGSKELADKLIDLVEDIVTNFPDKFALAKSTKDVEENFTKGLISLPMGMENGSPIEGDLANLQHFYDRGIRYITLTHAKTNHISDSSYDKNRPAKGLTDFGKQLITEMNNIGIMVDISHVSDDAFYQAIEISKTPVIASHSSARFFTPEFERNMSDDMIKLLAAKGGVIQISYGSSFISQTSINYSDTFKAARKAFVEEKQVSQDSEEVKAFTKAYREENPYPYASLEQVLDHYDHVVKLVGVDHVGIGSDFDGVGDSLPTDLKDVSYYPSLIQGLLDRGYSEEDISKILSGNFMRVWREVEEYANTH